MYSNEKIPGFDFDTLMLDAGKELIVYLINIRDLTHRRSLAKLFEIIEITSL